MFNEMVFVLFLYSFGLILCLSQSLFLYGDDHADDDDEEKKKTSSNLIITYEI